jgi:murein DD-endopeptidase
MSTRRRSLVVVIPLLCLIAGRATTTTQPALTLQIQTPPAAVAVDGGSELAYEVHLTNTAAAPIDLRRLDVLDGAGSVVTTYGADTLRARVGRLSGAVDAARRLSLAPGAEATVYVELVTPAPTLRALRHRVAFARAPDAGTPDDVVEGGAVAVRADEPLVLGPPLRGGPWAAVHNAAWERGHRRVFYTVGDRRRIPGRYAIDWIKLDADGRTSRDDADVVANALGYGADVLAVADAIVAATRDDVAEVARVSARRKHAVEDATGNYVALDVGRGRYVFYEHLKPGSVRVRPGERVRRGQPLAALGFTGDSTGPHLHLHVADAPSPLGAEGQPFVIDRFDLLGNYADAGDLGKRPWTPVGGTPRRERQRPSAIAVVSFEN